MGLDIGEHFGNYEILGVLGRGGCATVYLAEEEYPARKVALKVFDAFNARSEEQKARFFREIWMVAKISHPNIVRVFEAGQVDGRPYYSMEYIEGETLASKMERKSLPPKEVLHIMELIARALHYVHEKGIIHRDVKPTNILIDEIGRPYLADFGAALDLFSTEYLTMTGETIGTPYYMSPEQARGEMYDLDARSDIWSLGVIFYEALTGGRPFEGKPFEVMNKILEDTPAFPRKINTDIDRDLDTICIKCMDKVKARRYKTAGDLADDIRRYLDGEPIAARPRGLSERTIDYVRTHPLQVGTIALIFILLSTSLFSFVRGRQAKQWSKAQIAAFDFNKDFNVIVGEKGDNLFQNLSNLDRLFEVTRQRGLIDREIQQRSFLSLGDFFDGRNLPLMALRCYSKALETGINSKVSAEIIIKIARILFNLGEYEQAYRLANLIPNLEEADAGSRQIAEALIDLLDNFWPEETVQLPLACSGKRGIELMTSGDTDADGEDEIVLMSRMDGGWGLSFIPFSGLSDMESVETITLPGAFSGLSPRTLAAGDLDGRDGDELVVAFSDPSAGNTAHIVAVGRKGDGLEVIAQDTIESNIRGISMGNTDYDPQDEILVGVIYPERISRVYDLVEVDGMNKLVPSLLLESERDGRRRVVRSGGLEAKFIKGDAGAIAIGDVDGDGLGEAIVAAGFPDSYQIQIFDYNESGAEASYRLGHSIYYGETSDLLTVYSEDDGVEEMVFDSRRPPALFNSDKFPGSTAGLYLMECGDATGVPVRTRLIMPDSAQYDRMLYLSSTGGTAFLLADRIFNPPSRELPCSSLGNRLSEQRTSFLVLKDLGCFRFDMRYLFRFCGADGGNNGHVLVTVSDKARDQLTVWDRPKRPVPDGIDPAHIRPIDHDFSSEDGMTWNEWKDWGEEVRERLGERRAGEYNMLSEYMWYILRNHGDQPPSPDQLITVTRLLCKFGRYAEAGAFISFLRERWLNTSLPASNVSGGDSSAYESSLGVLLGYMRELVAFLDRDPREFYQEKRPVLEDTSTAPVEEFTGDAENQSFIENGVKATRRYSGAGEVIPSNVCSRPYESSKWSCWMSRSPLSINRTNINMSGKLVKITDGSSVTAGPNELNFNRDKGMSQFFFYDDPLPPVTGKGLLLDIDMTLYDLDLGQGCVIGIFEMNRPGPRDGLYPVAMISLGGMWNADFPAGFYRRAYDFFQDKNWIVINHVGPFRNFIMDHTYHCSIQYIPEMKRLRTSVIAPDYGYERSLLHYKEVINYDIDSNRKGDYYFGVLLFSEKGYMNNKDSVGISDITIRAYE